MNNENIEKDFELMVSQLAKNGQEISDSINAVTAHILHMAVGISGEAGELLDAIKKYVIYNKEPDLQNIIEELGDLEFYTEGLRKAFDITREEILYANIQKLSTRYKTGKYSDVDAQVRIDKIGEK